MVEITVNNNNFLDSLNFMMDNYRLYGWMVEMTVNNNNFLDSLNFMMDNYRLYGNIFRCLMLSGANENVYR